MNRKASYITLMQVVSAFAVVTLHTNGCFWTYSTARYWRTANVIECVFYFAVPIFFMITGATLIDFFDRYSLKTYFTKRIVKTVIPYVAWSLIAIVYRISKNSIAIESISFSYVMDRILNGDALSVYWFFPPLFAVYLCIPLFAAVEKEKRNTVFTYLLIAGFIVNSLIPFAKSVMGWSFAFPYQISVISGYLFFVVGGALLSKIQLKRASRFVIYALGVFGLLMHIIGTYSLSIANGQIIKTYKGYYNVPCILYSLALFIFFKQIGPTIMQGKLGKVIQTVGEYTFPIYLMQWYVMEGLRDAFHLNTFSIVYRLGMPFLIIPIVMAITWLLRKIPIVKRIVP